MSPKYYAVRVGKFGPTVYTNWQDCANSVNGYPGAKYKAFPTWEQAKSWSETLVPIALERNEPRDLEPRSFKPPSERDPTPPPPAPELSSEQQNVLRLALEGKSLFFTGSAGTGKSVLLKEIISALRHKHGRNAVAVTASTGIAAVNIGGVTIHSFAGIGLGKEPEKQLCQKVERNKATTKRWRQTHVLVIDEISMIDGLLFDKIEYIASAIKQQPNFGGLQLVISGDFFQLPPVPDIHDRMQLPITYCFDARAWNRCVPLMLTLTQVFRQKNQEFVDMLNTMRMGELQPGYVDKFRKLSRTVNYDDEIEPTELFPKRAQVDKANNTRLARLTTAPHTFTAMDYPGYDIRGYPIDRDHATKLLERVMAAPKITLKVGAQVMLVKNLQNGSGLVNGSIGRVIDFKTKEEALAAHTEVAEPGNSPAEEAQLSRWRPSTSERDPFHPANVRWPVVRFSNKKEFLMPPLVFSVENVLGKAEASRDQVPLILAWALSIHKSQGQTMERVKIDLGEVFEKGQAYVALSRATSMDTLQVLNFHPSKVMAHQRVIAWSKTLSSYKIRAASTVMDEDIEQEFVEEDEEDRFALEMDDPEVSEFYYTHLGK